MNQAKNETQGLSLPAPVAEPQAPNLSAPEQAVKAPEFGAAAPEKQAALTPPAMPFPAVPAQQMSSQNPLQPANDNVTPTTGRVVGKVIEDKDLIDKVWVEKAKAIINQTRDDPYKQTEELTEVKAEYLEQNYNKSIKLNK